MGVPSVCLCVGVILLITGLDAKSIKLVPTETKTIHTNGATHEISRYILVPDDGASNNTNNDVTEKETLVTDNGAIEDVINVDHDEKHEKSRKPADTDTEDSKLTNTTVKGKHFKVKYHFVNVARPVADVKQNVNVDESKSEAEVETNDTANSSSEKTAGDHNSFGHIQTKTITKTIYNPTKVTNIKFNELPLKWHDNEKGLNPLVSSIPINKTFTVPGKRGRFKLLHEDDEDIDTVIKHSTTYPKTQTRTHYYIDKYYLDDSGKIIPDVVNTDSSFRSNGQSGEAKPTLIKTYSSTSNKKDAIEIKSEKYHLRSSPSSNSFIEANQPFSYYTNIEDTNTDSSININNGTQKQKNDLVNISLQKSGKEPTPKKTITVSSYVSKSDIEQVEPKLKHTTILVTKPSSKIDSINESIPPNNDHGNTNVDGTHFSTNKFELVQTQEISETYPQLKNKNVDKTSNEHKILKISKIPPESKDTLRVLPLEYKFSEITNVLPNERVTVPTINTSSTKTNVIVTNGIKQNEPSSDISLQDNNHDVSVPKLVSLINKIENNHNEKGIVTRNPHEVTTIPDKIHIFSTKNNEVNVPTMESQTNTIELAPTVDKSNTITTKENLLTDRIILSKDHDKVTTPKVDLPINYGEIIPALDKTTVDKNYENQNKVLSTDGMINISSVQNQKEVTVNSDFLNHEIEITPKIYKTSEKTKIVTEYGNEHINKTVVVPTEKTKTIITMVENKVPTKTDVKPKQNHVNLLNYSDGNNHEIETEDTKTIHFSGKENLRISGISPIHKNEVQPTNSPNSKYAITMVSEVADMDEHTISASNTENNQTLSQVKTHKITTESNSVNKPKFDNIYISNRSGLENNNNTNVEALTDHTNIQTLLQKDKVPIDPPSKHIDLFPNILPEINTQLTPLEIKQEEPKPHVHCHKMNYKDNPTNENENSISNLNNDGNIKFRLDNHHTNLPPTNSEEIDDLVSNNWKSNRTDGIEKNPMQFEQFKNVLASKTPDVDSNDVDELDSEGMEHSKFEENPYEDEKLRSSRITYREETTENENERIDKNINQYASIGNKNYEPIEQPRRSTSYHNVADNYPLHTIGYVQLHPYQVYGGYHTHDNINPNYENVRFQNTQVNNDQYVQYILNYLISSSLIAEINAKYASAGQGVDINEIIMQTIVAYLQKLGIYNQIGQEQLQFLTQQIQQNEMINKNHKVEIIYEIDDQPTVIALPNPDVPNQYYLVPYANKERMTGVATTPNIRLLQDEAYLQRYLLEGFNVSTINFAVALSSRILQLITYLRNLRVPPYQILQFVVEVKKLTMEVLQTFMTECQSRAYVDLSQRIESMFKQFLQNYMLTRYPIQYY